MPSRLVALILALVLLFTQQLGLQHLLSHGLHGPVVHGARGDQGGLSQPAAADPRSSAATGDDGTAADGLCQACLVLAVLGMATLPGLLRWLALRQPQAAPAAPSRRALRRRVTTAYLARAPPAH